MRRKPTGRQGVLLFGGSAAVAAVAAAATAVTALIGFPVLADDGAPQAAPAEAPEAVAASWTQTLATTVLTNVLQDPLPGWKAEGGLQRAVVAPLPYSCPVQNSAASTSLARSYTVGGNRIRVTLQAYTAGLGAEALSQMHSGAAVCAGAEGAVAQSPIYGTAPGQDSMVASVSHGGQRTSVASFREGDVLVFTTGSNQQGLVDAAVQLDKSLSTKLQGICANTRSSVEDASRSVFSLAGYKPFTRKVTVSIPAVELPSTAPKASPSATASGTPSAKAEKAKPKAKALTPYPIPAPDLVDGPAEPMEEPGFPVWPLMPEPLDMPEAPKAPAAAAPTQKSFPVPAADTTGPGCGWAFTGQKAPGFDAGHSRDTEKKQSEQARRDLEAGAKDWQEDVLAYWKSYDSYKAAAEKYSKYADKVAETNRAWRVIAAEWDEYNAALDEYESDRAAREDFLDRRDAARAEYEKQVKICSLPVPSEAPVPQVPEKAPEPSPTPSSAPSPSAEPVPTADPAETRELKVRDGCPPEKPSILTEDVPEVPKAPEKPRDPRP
ncbi:hypothetical protein [Arthrobacter caoxuetaonis]|uniref:Uncharacterized protein n=1 Tax=Arthrobacter caoxuetaonis TaxID=2886935 RepID=A0A9X1MIA5_9MICC|nr:hypothetical protein [Arthrobacter caoxuetaonis]MCC3299437.1 hypothetical protein [Arthrobacter caoxuetaonis]USQ59070.1 hypothetical protein NF551_18365 [Arthrobacter caoxuetaonis]